MLLQLLILTLEFVLMLWPLMISRRLLHPQAYSILDRKKGKE